MAVSKTKEVRFFDDNYHLGIDWYASQFPILGKRHTGEASPSYLSSVQVPARIARDIPDALMICLLRNPVDRFYSSYWSETARGRTLGPIDELTRNFDPARDEGAYVVHLRRYEQLFPRSSLHIAFLEEMASRPSEVLRAVYRFLDIDEEFVPDTLGKRVNQYQEFRSLRIRRLAKRLPKPVRDAVGRLNRIDSQYPRMASSTRDRLLEHYQHFNEDLEDWLGRTLPESWRK